jgi:PAS domain S-box-containing protein
MVFSAARSYPPPVSVEGQSPVARSEGQGERQDEAGAILLGQLRRGAPLQEMLLGLVRGVELRAPGLMASVLVVEHGRLHVGAAPTLPAGYNLASDDHPIGEGFGSCGTAAHRGELVVADDIQSDALWKNYREIARRYELGACWSMPILTVPAEPPAVPRGLRGRNGREVLGTFALYHTRPRRPRHDELELIESFAAHAGVAIQFHLAREALRSGEDDRRALVEAMEVIQWESAGESRRLSLVSERAAARLAHPRERWQGEPGFWASIIHPEDREATLRRFQEASRRGQDIELEYRLLTGDGGTMWVRDLGRMRTDRATGHRSLSGLMIDISRQREAEQEREDLFRRLHAERNLLRGVVQRIPGAVVIAAPDGRILVASSEAERVLAPRLMQGGRLDADQLGGSIGRAMRGGQVLEREELELARPDGSKGTVRASVAPVHDAEGRLVASIVVLTDVTESRAEATLRLLADAGSALGSTLELDAITRNLAALAVRELADWCVVFATTEQGGLQCAALEHRNDPAPARAAAEFERLLAHPGGVPFRLSAVLASGEPQLFPEISPDAFEPGAVRPEVMRLVRTLGGESAMAVPLAGQTRSLGAVVYVSCAGGRPYGPADLLVGRELARRAALAMENARLYHEAHAAIRQREEFLSIAAHELNTPLASLQLTLQTLLTSLERVPLDVPFMRGRAEAGERHCLRLARLVSDLLDVSRIQAGRMRLASQRMDLVAAVHAALGRLQEELARLGIDVTVHATGPVEGSWDPHRIEQVITNLLTNAIKYGDRRPVRVVVEDADDVARLEVQDQGIGMDQELLTRLFGAFERGAAAGDYGGLGLGLYITAQIVRAHGGSITARSAPGDGATFIVELPRRATM